VADWNWIGSVVALIVHEEQLRDHGGPQGVRDVTLLESALAKPQNLASYGDPDAAALAASYAFGIARNHPFVDGNKRISAVISETFLNMNGYTLTASDPELAVAIESLAAGELSEVELASWFREHLAKD